jgi:hypothetical protein
MNGTTTTTLSRRGVALLAAALLATFMTAAGTIGGFAHWNASAASVSAPTSTPMVQQAAPQQWTEEAD